MMTVSKWIREKEIRGQAAFTLNELFAAFPHLAVLTVRRELSAQVKVGRVANVYRGFYVIVPPQYALKGVIPPAYFIDRLMKYRGKPYYVAMLSAASLLGASHQRVMKTQVMTIPPRSTTSNISNLIDWNYRQQIPSELLVRTNTETGTMLYSCPELTAADLFQYSDNVGGYQRASTVLAELVEHLDMSQFNKVKDFSTVASLQRMGCVIEFILGEKEKADVLFDIIRTKGKVLKSIKMSNRHPAASDASSNRWHVNMNINIEIDDL